MAERQGSGSNKMFEKIAWSDQHVGSVADDAVGVALTARWENQHKH